MPATAARTTRAVATLVVAGSLLAGVSACGAAGRSEGTGPSGTVTVFAAASLAAVGRQWESELEAANPGLDVLVVLEGSAGLARQLLDGAPADVFVSADERTMATVVAAGLATDTSPLARNHVVVAVPIDNPGRLERARDVSRRDVTVAVCDEPVPCGAAADRAFSALGLDVDPTTVEPNVTAVLTRVRLGQVDAGVVYATDARAAGEGVRVLDLPPTAETAGSTTYQATALNDAPNQRAAREVVDHVLSPEGQAALAEAGFTSP